MIKNRANKTSYNGIINPTITLETTEEELKQEMTGILTELMEILE